MNRAEEKTERIRKALSHQEGDRVPVGEFFWTGFLKSCRNKWGENFDPYRHFDLDYVIVNPNMDPRIMSFEVVEDTEDDTVVRTGFGATIRVRRDFPMPRYETFSVGRPEEMASFELENPTDPRRFFEGGEDQLNCVGDGLVRGVPSWEERVDGYEGDIALFGSICEPFEYLWRVIGTENALVWMATDTEALAAFVNRIGQFLFDFTAAQIEAARGRLAGMYIWGDVAYIKGMLFGKERWREIFRPHVKKLIDLCRSHNLMVVYHGCGDSRAIFDDFVELGLDCYNPLEAKAGLDVVELKKTYGGKLAFCGNIDVRVLESGDPEAIEKEVLYKLQAAKGGGWIFQSDHSVSSQVTPESYELALQILRENGDYPLNL